MRNSLRQALQALLPPAIAASPRTPKRKIHDPRTIIPLLSALLALSCVKDGRGERLHEGEPLPGFTVTTLEGAKVTSEDLAGKPSAVILFSTTCPDCQRQLPALESLWRSHADRLNVLAIARSEDAGTVASFWSSASYTMPAAAPGNRSVYDLFDRGSGTGVPQVYVSDAAGTVLLTGDDRDLLDEEKILRAAFPDNK